MMPALSSFFRVMRLKRSVPGLLKRKEANRKMLFALLCPGSNILSAFLFILWLLQPCNVLHYAAGLKQQAVVVRYLFRCALVYELAVVEHYGVVADLSHHIGKVEHE